MVNLTFFDHFGADGHPELGRLEHKPRAQSLLAYLIIENQPVTRSHLAETLWPLSSQQQSKTNLRRELHTLFKEIPLLAGNIQTTSQTLQWLESDTLTSDIHEFRREHANFQQVQKLTAKPEKGELENATFHAHNVLALHKGVLLSECKDEWIEPCRNHFLSQWNTTALWMTEILTSLGRYDDAHSAVGRLLGHNPWNEKAFVLLLKLLRAQGRVTEMHVKISEYRERLEAELCTEPGPDLQVFLDSLINKNSISSTASHSTSVSKIEKNIAQKSSLQISQLRFVGRQAEIKQLEQIIEPHYHKRPCLILISGEAGIGKSRLLTEAILSGHETVPTAQCFNVGTRIPLHVLSQWLESEALQRHVKELDEKLQQVLQRFFPQLDLKVTDTEHGTTKESHQQHRSMLIRAMAAVFEKSRISVVTIEDIHWCDSDSLDVLNMLLTSMDRPVQIVATARSEEYRENLQFQELMAHLQSSGNLHLVEINPLDPSESLALSRQLVASLDESTITDSTLNKLGERSGGNPFLLIELVLHSQSGAMKAGEDQYLVPARISAIVEQRLNKLDQQSNAIVQTIAVLGRSCSPELILQANGIVDHSSIDAFDGLIQIELLTENINQEFYFRHELIRDAVLQNMTSARRKFLHHRIALAYTQLYKSQPNKVSSQIAWHFSQSGLINQAYDWYVSASIHAYNDLTYRDCLSLCDKAIEHQSKCNLDQQLLSQRVSILLRKAEVAASLFGFASHLVREACDELKNLDIEANDFNNYFQLLDRHRTYASFSGASTNALQIARQMVNVSDSRGIADQRVEAHRAVAMAQLQLGNYAASARSLNSAISIGNAAFRTGELKRHSPPTCYLMSLYMSSHIQMRRGMTRLSITALEKADSFDTSHLFPNAWIFLNLARSIACYLHRDRVRSQQSIQVLRSVGQKSQRERARSFANAFDGASHPSHKEGIRLLKNALADYEKLHELMFTPMFLLLLAKRQIDAEDAFAARESIDRGLNLCDTGKNSDNVGELFQAQARVRYMLGEAPTRVDSSLDRSIKLSRKQGSRLFTVSALCDRLEYQLEWYEEGGSARKGAGDWRQTARELQGLVSRLEKHGDNWVLEDARSLLVSVPESV